MLSAILKFVPTWYSKDGKGRAYDLGNGVVLFIERKRSYRVLVDGEIRQECISGEEIITLLGDAPQELEIAISRVYSAPSGVRYAEIAGLARPIGKVTRVAADELWQALGVGAEQARPARARAARKAAPSAEIPL